MRKASFVTAIILIINVLALPSLGQEIIKETTQEVTREFIREVTKEVIRENKTGIRPYIQATYGQYELESLNEFLNFLRDADIQGEGIVFVGAGPEPVDSGFSYEAGFVFPIRSWLRMKIGAQYYLLKNEYLYKFYVKDSQFNNHMQSHITYDLRTLGAIAKLTLGSEKANFYLGTGYYRGTYKYEDVRWSTNDDPPYKSSSSNWLGMGYEAGFEFKIAKVNFAVGYSSLILPPESGDYLIENFDLSGLRASVGLEF